MIKKFLNKYIWPWSRIAILELFLESYRLEDRIILRNLAETRVELDHYMRVVYDSVCHYDDLAIFEYSSGFEVMEISTGRTHWMSDGVDMYHTEDGEQIYVATPEFYQSLWWDLRTSYNDWLEAYFPEEEQERDN